VFLGEFGNGIDTLMHGPTLPVPVFVSLHFLEPTVLADGLVHASLYHIRGFTISALILRHLQGLVTRKGNVVEYSANVNALGQA
jgi:hypothetical protein